MNEPKQQTLNNDPVDLLRDILLTGNKERIAELERQIRQLSGQLNEKEQLLALLEPIIGDLLDNKIRNSGDEMADALSPIMGEAIRRQVVDARDDVVDALYPVVGKMVTKSVSESMKKLVAQMNSTLNKTFDFRTIMAHLKARMTGVSAGEVLLAGMAPFFIDSVFLISKDSGLLVAYCGNSDTGSSDDANVIGGMLTAIKSFVETSFTKKNEGELKEIEHSDRTIRIESGRYTYLAAVYSGSTIKEIDKLLKETHTAIHKRFYKKLRQYNGDNSGLDSIETMLKDFIKKAQDG